MLRRGAVSRNHRTPSTGNTSFENTAIEVRIVTHIQKRLMLICSSGNPSDLYMHGGDSSGGARIHQLQHLDQLILCEGQQQFVLPADLPQDLKMLNIKKLYLGTQCFSLIGVSITPASTNVVDTSLADNHARTRYHHMQSSFDMVRISNYFESKAH
jgi:hypothetical protein